MSSFIDSFINTHPVITGILCVIIIAVCMVGVFLIYKWERAAGGKDGPQSIESLTPTQRFILAASSPTIGNNYKCVIDIWDTHKSEVEVEKVVQLFEWGWGEFTYENVKNAIDDCLHRGYNVKYPNQGMLGWDLVRVLSIVGAAYMGGIMEYGEAAGIALDTCRLLQENFSSWDDMVGSYTLGYQQWRGRKKKDRLKYYKKLKRYSWIYKISWDTVLREDEL